MGKIEQTKALPLQYIKGIGPNRAKAFAKEGIFTIKDLLYYVPRAYVDRTAVSSIMALAVKLRQQSFFDDSFESSSFILYSEVTIVGKIIQKNYHSYAKNKKMLKLVVSDFSNGKADVFFWNYVDYYDKHLNNGDYITISGKPQLDRERICFHHPDIEHIDKDEEETYLKGLILPIYRVTHIFRSASINIKLLRDLIGNLIEKEAHNLVENLPNYILKKYNFPSIIEAIKMLHYPNTAQDIEIAKKRMKYEEILFFQILLAIRQRNFKNEDKGIAFRQNSPNAKKLYKSLPFTLTEDQKKAIREILEDFRSGKPMNRLLQGDVGCGKTIVALLAMLYAIDNGSQIAFMAPTELLVEQHYCTLKNLLKDFNISIVQLVGGQSVKIRKEILGKISTGEANIIVGTHALFQSDIIYNQLGFIVIDEQHRFGVAQRAELKHLSEKSYSKEKISPHILVMSATPIPRTLSLTLYGDLDVSIIKELPKNRKPVVTKIVFQNQLQQVYDFIKRIINKGQQAFIVYPLIEKSEKLQLKSAVEHFELLKTEIFKEYKCGLLHGQMFWYEKEDIMKTFLNKGYNILVATTVIEVGIDIPNATVMLIENAERFGLSQLHQLRGRVGRGAEQSYCILATKDHYQNHLKNDNLQDDRIAAIIRLKTMAETNDGFKISEVDLKLRGPGDIMGTRQSGLPNFKFLDLVNDLDIITMARRDAWSIVQQDPELKSQININIRNKIIEDYKNSSFIDIA